MALLCRFLLALAVLFVFLSSVRIASHWVSCTTYGFNLRLDCDHGMLGGMVGTNPMRILVEA